MRVLIAGDFCPRERVAKSFDEGDFQSILGEVRSIASQVDYSIVNFECPVVTTNQANPIDKQGPNLACSRNGVKAIKFAGFECVTLANNHFYDYGEDGVEETLETLEEEGISYVGGGRNLSEAQKILYKSIHGKKLAIINCCEHEFSIATHDKAGSNPLNPIQQYYSIQEARKNADKVLVIVHGGHEHFQLPSPRMVETYRFFVDAGANAVVNHHQHCFSGYEVYKGSPIFYGVGNFCFDKTSMLLSIWTEGFLVEIDFGEHQTSFIIHPYRQCGESPAVVLLPKDCYNEKLLEINKIISSKVELKKHADKYYSESASTLSSILEPIRNHYYLGAKRRGWLPSFIDMSRRLEARDFILCESHRDILSYWFEKM